MDVKIIPMQNATVIYSSPNEHNAEIRPEFGMNGEDTVRHRALPGLADALERAPDPVSP